MKKNKVIAQLTMLPEKEFKLFGKFVRNTIYNKKETVTRLYQFVAKNHPDYDTRKFSKTQCFLHIFPELKPQMERLNGEADALISKKLKNPLYDLKNLIEAFIIQQEMAAQSHEKTILLIKGLFKRKMHEKAFQLIDKELKRLEGMIGDDFYHHFYQFQLLELKLNNTLDKVKLSVEGFNNLQSDLDLFFIHAKLKIGFEMKTRNKLYGENYDLLFFDEVKKLITDGLVSKANFSVALYAKISDLNESSTSVDFQKTKNFYFKNLNKLCKSEKKEPLIYLQNFSMQAYKKGETTYMQQMFDLYQFGLKNDILIENGYLSPDDFKNIVSASIRLKKFDFAIQFLENKAFLLPENVRDDMVLLAKANLVSSQQEFSMVIELLANVTFHNTYDNLMARILMMRSYYELGEFSALESFLASYDKFIRRNKSISDEVKIPILNMIKFTKHLNGIKFKGGNNKESLINKLNSFEMINSKKWLLKKIAELR